VVLDPVRRVPGAPPSLTGIGSYPNPLLDRVRSWLPLLISLTFVSDRLGGVARTLEGSPRNASGILGLAVVIGLAPISFVLFDRAARDVSDLAVSPTGLILRYRGRSFAPVYPVPWTSVSGERRGPGEPGRTGSAAPGLDPVGYDLRFPNPLAGPIIFEKCTWLRIPGTALVSLGTRVTFPDATDT
jgi:hypothetical protein